MAELPALGSTWPSSYSFKRASLNTAVEQLLPICVQSSTAISTVIGCSYEIRGYDPCPFKITAKRTLAGEWTVESMQLAHGHDVDLLPDQRRQGYSQAARQALQRLDAPPSPRVVKKKNPKPPPPPSNAFHPFPEVKQVHSRCGRAIVPTEKAGSVSLAPPSDRKRETAGLPPPSPQVRLTLGRTRVPEDVVLEVAENIRDEVTNTTTSKKREAYPTPLASKKRHKLSPNFWEKHCESSLSSEEEDEGDGNATPSPTAAPSPKRHQTFDHAFLSPASAAAQSDNNEVSEENRGNSTLTEVSEADLAPASASKQASPATDRRITTEDDDFPYAYTNLPSFQLQASVLSSGSTPAHPPSVAFEAAFKGSNLDLANDHVEPSPLEPLPTTPTATSLFVASPVVPLPPVASSSSSPVKPFLPRLKAFLYSISPNLIAVAPHLYDIGIHSVDELQQLVYASDESLEFLWGNRGNMGMRAMSMDQCTMLVAGLRKARMTV